MPKSTDIHSILVIGSGPIIIGQACEFDYSGTQAVKVLKREGFKVVLVNSNPATIMTDGELADRTYIEPLDAPTLEKIILREKVDAVLPTVGGQTALNLARELSTSGFLAKHKVRLIGADLAAIEKAESRELFRKAMQDAHIEVPLSGIANTLEQALQIAEDIGYPVIIRPSYTLGGSGQAICYNREEMRIKAAVGLSMSPIHQALVEESLFGWKEYEFEVMRDKADNVTIICTIENLSPMGVHTGDSITVAPIQTLTDRELQHLRDICIKVMRVIGVETGGSNVQFAVNPQNGRTIVIEMNPRVSRSSALASKATGFPIAKIAALLSVGYTLNEITNDITLKTKAAFEPTLDYVVTKIPRFTFEKFSETRDELSAQMKSVGEVMAIGRTFKESLQKAMRSLEIDKYGFDPILDHEYERYLKYQASGQSTLSKEEYLIEKLRGHNSLTLWYVGEAFRNGWSLERVHEITRIDPWFLNPIQEIIEAEKQVAQLATEKKLPDADFLRHLKRQGFSDIRLSRILTSAGFACSEAQIREQRKKNKILPHYKMIDTCAAEFASYTQYFYSTYNSQAAASDQVPAKDKTAQGSGQAYAILGSGPNRIGQGIEFDYCCVRAAATIRKLGHQALMINCNPETVSTDYDVSDKLFFEPLTLEDVSAVLDHTQANGSFIHFGGQTPLKLAKHLHELNYPIMGTSYQSIDIAEDREKFRQMCNTLNITQPLSKTCFNSSEGLKIAQEIGFPVLIRPSYVLGGRAMEIVWSEHLLNHFIDLAQEVAPNQPILVDQFLENASELDVDCLSDGENCIVVGIMEHIQEAGIHSGDSVALYPPRYLSEDMLLQVRQKTEKIAKHLKIKGVMNIQFAIYNSELFIIEVNPRASRTMPFISKASGVPIIDLACKISLGQKVAEFNLPNYIQPKWIATKEVVFPFIKFAEVDTILGPEMKSTGEVMGIAQNYPESFALAQKAAKQTLPLAGSVFISVKDSDKSAALELAKQLTTAGFQIISTSGTYQYLKDNGVANAQSIKKAFEGRPNAVDLILNGKIQLVLNTTFGEKAIKDSFSIRRKTLEKQIPYFTTIQTAKAAVEAILFQQKHDNAVKSIQEVAGYQV